MEIRLFRAQTNSMMRFLVIFLVVISYSVHASDYGETEFLEKYIAKTYFDKYDIFIDSVFNHFIANEIPLGLSKLLQEKNHDLPTLFILNRSIIGEGSHRRLSSSMRLKMQPKLKSEPSTHSCQVIIIEKLPSGVFADPFELQHLVQRGVFNDAAVFGDRNLEQPSFRSNQSAVEIHVSIGSEVLTIHDDYLEVNLEVPLHARYPPLGHDSFWRVEFGQPDLFMCFSLEGNSLNRSCLSMPIADYTATSPVIWEIPCGIKEHAEVVSAVTFGFAAVTAFLIVFTSISYSGGSNKSKLT